MRYLILLAEKDPYAWDQTTEEQRQAVFEAHSAFAKAASERGTIVGGEALATPDMAVTLPGADDADRPVTAGPYAETVEQICGFYVIDAPDLDTMVDLCRILPAGYTVEIRPAIEIEGYEG